MSATSYSRSNRWMPAGAGFVVCCVLLAGEMRAQQASPSAQAAAKPAAPASAGGAGQGEVLDRVIAVVNGDLILESDVDEERRFEQIQPFREGLRDMSRARAIQRLVDRALIRQQAALEPEAAVTDKEVDAEIVSLRKDNPDCKQYHCETDEGWARYLGEHGFTPYEFREHWRRRMELLKFIEVRFRNGITITDDQIENYYQKIMLPEYAERHVTPPPVDAISKRIQEVLLQQQVSALLVDWLKSLRAQGSVRIITLGDAAP